MVPGKGNSSYPRGNAEEPFGFVGKFISRMAVDGDVIKKQTGGTADRCDGLRWWAVTAPTS
jgi:hypothetical protein